MTPADLDELERLCKEGGSKWWELSLSVPALLALAREALALREAAKAVLHSNNWSSGMDDCLDDASDKDFWLVSVKALKALRVALARGKKEIT